MAFTDASVFAFACALAVALDFAFGFALPAGGCFGVALGGGAFAAGTSDSMFSEAALGVAAAALGAGSMLAAGTAGTTGEGGSVG